MRQCSGAKLARSYSRSTPWTATTHKKEDEAFVSMKPDPRFMAWVGRLMQRHSRCPLTPFALAEKRATKVKITSAEVRPSRSEC
jgi:hypothetical protein